MKFPGYFLIVWDFIRYAKENGIPVGPGRGSGAGSIVAYAMRITDLDPIPYNLLFERFLNPERVSHARLRRRLLHGPARPGHRLRRRRSTARTASGRSRRSTSSRRRASSRTSARVHGHPAHRGAEDREPHPAGRRPPRRTRSPRASRSSRSSRRCYDTDPRIKELLDAGAEARGAHAPRRQARRRHRHQRGAALGPRARASRTEERRVRHPVLQGRRRAGGPRQVRLPRPEDAHGHRHRRAPRSTAARTRGEGSRTFDLVAHPARRQARPTSSSGSGETKGVFQLESSGMQQLFKDLKPDGFEDIVAAVALYRPGPLGSGMVKDFVDCKHGRAADREDAPARRRAPRAHVRRHRLPGAGHADRAGARRLLARRRRSAPPRDGQEEARGDGQAEEHLRRRAPRTTASTRRTPSASSALLEYFAGYGFNKSHSAAYALITYQTAYLKAHYPVEFLCALMTSDKDKIEKVVRTIADARAMGVTVLPPDINESDTDFKVVYTHPAGDQKRRRAARSGSKDALRAADPLRPRRGARRRRRGARGSSRRATAGGPFARPVRLRRARRRQARQQGRLRGARAVRGVRRDARAARASRARGRSRRSTSRSSARARRAAIASAGRRTCSASSTRRPPQDATARRRRATTRTCEPWDLRETARAREAVARLLRLGPPARALRARASAPRQLDARPIAELAAMDDWARRDASPAWSRATARSIFKDGGGKIAFFELEDLTGASR